MDRQFKRVYLQHFGGVIFFAGLALTTIPDGLLRWAGLLLFGLGAGMVVLGHKV